MTNQTTGKNSAIRLRATVVSLIFLACTVFSDLAASAPASGVQSTTTKSATKEETKDNKSEMSPAEKVAALKKMAVDKDKIEGITWYRDKSTQNVLNRNSLSLYIGQKNGSTWMRFRVLYSDDSWLFFKRFTIKADDQLFEFSAPNPEHYVGSGYVSEWYDVAINKQLFEAATAVASAKESVLRLEGKQFRKDRVISTSEKKAILHVIDAYRALGEKGFI